MLLTAPELHLFQKGRCILLSPRMHHSLLWKMPWKLSYPKSFPPKFSWTDELLKSRRWDGAPAPVRRSLQRAHLRGCLITPTPVPTAQGPTHMWTCLSPRVLAPLRVSALALLYTTHRGSLHTWALPTEHQEDSERHNPNTAGHLILGQHYLGCFKYKQLFGILHLLVQRSCLTNNSFVFIL